MGLGIAGHCLCLEEEIFDSMYEVCEESLDKRTKAYKNIKARAEEDGKTLITVEDYEKLQGCKRELMNHPASSLFQNSIKEHVVLWEHAQSGVSCKSKIDLLGPDFVADLKFTSKEIDPTNDYDLLRTIYSNAYYRQIVFYNEPFNKDHMYIVFIEVEPPHEITWIDIAEDPNWTELAQREIDIAMSRYLDYQEWIKGGSPSCSGYSTERRLITCPEWAFDRVNRLIGGRYEF